MENPNISRIVLSKEMVGGGDWDEILTVLSDGTESEKSPDNMKLLYVAKFGVFENPRHWGRMLGSMVRTLALGETRFRSLPDTATERVEAEIAEGFNEALIGTENVIVSKQEFKMEGDDKKEKPPPPSINWNPDKKDWPFE